MDFIKIFLPYIHVRTYKTVSRVSCVLCVHENTRKSTYQEIVWRVMLLAFADVFVIAALDVWATGAVGDDGRVERVAHLRYYCYESKQLLVDKFFLTISPLRRRRAVWLRFHRRAEAAAK